MSAWRVVFTRQATKDSRLLTSAGLRNRAEELLLILANDPFQSAPIFEKLRGEMAGMYSRRLNIQHRLVYEVFAEERTVRILRMWTHYE